MEGEHAPVTGSVPPATARTSRVCVCDLTKQPLHDAHIRSHGRYIKPTPDAETGNPGIL